MVFKKKCYYLGCSNDSHFMLPWNRVFFVPFPKPKICPLKCKLWLNLCRNGDASLSDVERTWYICSAHFTGGAGPTVQFPDPLPCSTRTSDNSNIVMRVCSSVEPEEGNLFVAENVKIPVLNGRKIKQSELPRLQRKPEIPADDMGTSFHGSKKKNPRLAKEPQTFKLSKHNKYYLKHCQTISARRKASNKKKQEMLSQKSETGVKNLSLKMDVPDKPGTSSGLENLISRKTPPKNKCGTVCCVPCCRNDNKRNSNVSFHKFPRDLKRREIWIQRIKFQGDEGMLSLWSPNANTRICGIHFNVSGVKDKKDNVPIYFPWKTYHGEPTEVTMKNSSVSSKGLTIEDLVGSTNMTFKTDQSKMKNEDTPSSYISFEDRVVIKTEPMDFDYEPNAIETEPDTFKDNIKVESGLQSIMDKLLSETEPQFILPDFGENSMNSCDNSVNIKTEKEMLNPQYSETQGVKLQNISSPDVPSFCVINSEVFDYKIKVEPGLSML